MYAANRSLRANGSLQNNYNDCTVKTPCLQNDSPQRPATLRLVAQKTAPLAQGEHRTAGVRKDTENAHSEPFAPSERFAIFLLVTADLAAILNYSTTHILNDFINLVSW
jgi:hypothetical protein